jgi:3-hydroxyisobutyrate dehydrogenase
MATEEIGFVGLGTIGSLLAGRLLAYGEALAVFDVRPDALVPLVEQGARACGSPAEVADHAETVFVSLPMPDIVETVLAELLEGSRMGTFVDLSTTGPTVATRLAARLAAAGVAYLDAPVSGGPKGAASGRLTVMAAGAAATFARIEPLLRVFGEKVLLVGERPGDGQLTKLINNLISATAIAITGEALAFGVRGGLDPAMLLEAINASSGRTTASADKYPNCVLTRTFDYGFRLRLMAKDVALCIDEAKRQKSPMLLGALVEQLWSIANAAAAEEDDCTTIAQLFEAWAGVRIESAS